MTTDTILKLNELNRLFYQKVASDFSATRQQPWPGWEKAWETMEPLLPGNGQVSILDLGAGNGRFGFFMQDKLQPSAERPMEYLAIDESLELTTELKEKYFAAEFLSSRISQQDLVKNLLERGGLLNGFGETFDIVVSFGVIHHVPSLELRQSFFQNAAKLLKPGGILIVSLWQFDKNEKLMERQTSPEAVGIKADELEKNDYFLTWERGQKAVRYCHLVNEAEQQTLISGANLKVVAKFSADGKTGSDNLYLILRSH